MNNQEFDVIDGSEVLGMFGDGEVISDPSRIKDILEKMGYTDTEEGNDKDVAQP